MIFERFPRVCSMSIKDTLSADIFRTRGEEAVNFSRFCADIFYGQPLSIRLPFYNAIFRIQYILI